MGEEKSRVRVVLSELSRLGWIFRLKRGWYASFDPYIALVRGDWKNLVKQHVYLPLILSVSTRLLECFNGDLISIAIFGSVARGITLMLEVFWRSVPIDFQIGLKAIFLS